MKNLSKAQLDRMIKEQAEKPKVDLVSLPRYHDDGPFDDPVVRCDSCQKLVLVTTIHKMGKCPHCGRGRFAKMRVFNSQELAWMKQREIDPEFLQLFGPVEGVDL